LFLALERVDFFFCIETLFICIIRKTTFSSKSVLFLGLGARMAGDVCFVNNYIFGGRGKISDGQVFVQVPKKQIVEKYLTLDLVF